MILEPGSEEEFDLIALVDYIDDNQDSNPSLEFYFELEDAEDFVKWDRNNGELTIEAEDDHIGEYEIRAILTDNNNGEFEYNIRLVIKSYNTNSFGPSTSGFGDNDDDEDDKFGGSTGFGFGEEESE